MKRLTATFRSDLYVCRLKGCMAEEWMWDKYHSYPEDVCDGCPFMEIVNKLAEYEDENKEEE